MKTAKPIYLWAISKAGPATLAAEVGVTDLVEVMVTDSAKASSTERMQQVAETANFK